MFKDKKTRNDMILGLAVIILAAGIWLATELLKKDGSFAVVTVNGTETARYSLSEDAEIRLESENGGFNIFGVTMYAQQILALLSLIAVIILIIYMRLVIAPLKRVKEAYKSGEKSNSYTK